MSNDAETAGKQPGKQSGKKSKAYTAPKGRPTVHNVPGASNRRFSSTVEWIVAIVVFLLILAAIFYFGRNFRSETGFSMEQSAQTLLASAGAVLSTVVA